MLWASYGGHGVMKNNNYIVLNELINKERFYDFEYRLSVLAETYTNTCIVLNLDCCREIITDS